MELRTHNEHVLYQHACRYVERVQESFNLVLSVEEWERTVQKVYDAMKFHIRSDSATEQLSGAGSDHG